VNARSVALAALIAVTLSVSGCSGSPEPVETTPGFSSEEEAFAAAEETYRAYVDALNQVDLSDPETFEPVFALTTGDFESTERTNLSTMHADGWAVKGESLIRHLEPQSASPDFSSVKLIACIDVTRVQLVDETGVSMVGEDRPPIQSLLVHLTSGGSAARYSIAEVTGGEVESC
jgi:hypothetical protein